MIVQLLPIRVRAILNHSLTNLVASLEVHTPRWRSLIILLLPHSRRLSCNDLLIVQGANGIADTHHAIDGI